MEILRGLKSRKIILTLTVFAATIFISFMSTDSVSEVIKTKLQKSANSSLIIQGDKIHTIKTIQRLYEKSEYKAIWDTQLTDLLIKEIKNATQEGLFPVDYHLEILIALQNSKASDISLAEIDLLSSDAFLMYASHLLSGKVNSEKIDPEWKVIHKEQDFITTLIEAIHTKNMKLAFDNCKPLHPEYQILKRVLKSHQSLVGSPWEKIEEGETIKPNQTSLRIPNIRKRLSQLGDLTKEHDLGSDIHDETLQTAVIRFQKRHGLEHDGSIGLKTIKALNISIEERIATIQANLERWRWLPKELGNYYVLVNIAGFNLDVVKNGKKIKSHKVISGKPARKTPVFSSQMQNIVLNPTWTVPPGILNADVIPNVRKDISYLNKKKLTIYDSKGNVISPSTIDWNSSAPKSYTYIQPPGEDNSLGAVKFMFPNSHSVYLHDTPSKDLFDKTERAFSSGCIRVEHPLDLAELLLNDSEKWNRKNIDKIISTKITQSIKLSEKPFVHLLYWTSWVDENGIINFRNDIYLRDAPLIQALNKKDI